MAGGVINGQPVDEAITNPAFIIKNADDTMPNKLSLANLSEGASIDGVQTTLNKLYAATGASEIATGTAYSAPANTITDGDSHETALRDLADKFHPTTGHTHDGTAGNGAPVSASSLVNYVLKGYILQGTDTTLSGASIDVTALMAGKTESGGPGIQGVVVDAPYNYVTLRNAQGSEFYDDAGDLVYGRLTYGAGVWTLTFYSHSTSENPYTFTAPQAGAHWYYQHLYHPLVNAPVYDPQLFIPSDNATADVHIATQALQGKTLLSSAAGADIASTGAVGTANGTVANSDHTHRGVSGAKATGGSAIYGEVEIAGAGGSSTSQLGQVITVTSPSLASTAPEDVGATANVGNGTTTARDNHVHRGVGALFPTGGSNIYGAVELGVAGELSIGQALQKITITGKSFGATAQSVASANAGGSSGDMSRADHAHQGVHGIKVSGESNLFGDVVLAEGTNVTLDQTGNTITINSTGGGGGGGSVQPFLAQEIPTGTVDGSNDTFVLSATPYNTASVFVFVDSLLIPSDEWTRSGTSIIFNAGSIPQPSQVVYVAYVKSTETYFAGYQETPGGTIDGVNDTFDLAGMPSTRDCLAVYVDGILREKTEWNFLQSWNLTSIQFVAGSVPQPSQSVYVVYLTPVGSYAPNPIGGSGTGSLTVLGTYAAPATITAVSGISAPVSQRQMNFIQSDGGPITISANPQIAAGTNVGQELIIQGTSATNTVTLSDGTGLSLNGSATLGDRDAITLVWDGDVWSEVSRR